MKLKTKVLLLLATTLLFSLYSFAQRGARIAYVDMEYILENVEEYRDATEQLAAKVQKWKGKIEKRQRVIEQMRKDLMAEKVLLTDELIGEREEEIEILEEEMLSYQQDRFGPEGDLVLQKRKLIQPIQDQVFNEVQTIGKNKKYDFILDKSADVVMLYSVKRFDISDLVLKRIARTRKVSAPKKKERPKERIKEDNRLDDGELEDDGPEVEEINDALLERKEKAKQAEEARIKTVNERRAEQLKLREERKKAYELRRKKLLEEREAKRQAKIEERKNAIAKKEETEKEDIKEEETEKDN